MTYAKRITTFLRMTALLLAALLIIPIAAPMTASAADTSLKSSAYAPTITAGKTYALMITAVGDKSITAEVDNKSVISFKWDTKWSGDTIKIFITGNKAGTAKLTVKSKTKQIDINVTVTDSTAASGVRSNKDTVNIKKGGSGNFTITSSNHDLQFKIGNKSVVSASMGKWIGNKCKFTVKGLKNGTTTISIVRKSDKQVCAVITVNVGNTSSSGSSAVTTTAEVKEEQPVSQSASFDEQVLKLVNEARAENGLSPMKLSSDLTDAANKRAEEITSVFDHKRPDGKDCFTVFGEYSISSYNTAGENIAGGFATAEDVVNGWMNSPGHRANILNPAFTTLGVGKSGAYWVQLFIG